MRIRRCTRNKRNSRKIGCICGHYNYFSSYGWPKKGRSFPQKLYAETVSVYLLIAFAQLSQKIGRYAEVLCSEELTISSLSIHTLQNPMSPPFQCKATVEVYIAYLNRRLIDVPSQWFSEYSTSYMGTMHESYISEIESTKLKRAPFGS